VPRKSYRIPIPGPKRARFKGKADIDNLIEALTSSLDSIVQYYGRQTGEAVALSD